MAFPPRVLALLLVLLTGATAGCNFQLWYDQSGRFFIELDVQGPDNSSITDFQRLKIAVYGVSVKQIQFIETKEFSFGDEPLVVDALKAGLERQRIPLVEGTMSIRAVEHVTVRLDVVEAVDSQGKSIPVCKETQETTTFPCFFLPTNNAFRITRSFSPPRGGDVTFGFPLSVKSVALGGDTEYLFDVPSAQARVETRR